MRIAGIVWLRDVIDKLEWKHRVTTDEVEQVLASQPRFKFTERGKLKGEDVYAALGRTEAGRYLIVWFIYKETREALILSARQMDSKEKRRYGKK